MDIRMYNSGFDILLRSVHYSAKLRIAKYPKTQKIKCYLLKASWVFEFSYKLYFAIEGTPHLAIYWYIA